MNEFIKVIKHLESHMDFANVKYGKEDNLCLFCHSKTYDGLVGIVHHEECPIRYARQKIIEAEQTDAKECRKCRREQDEYTQTCIEQARAKAFADAMESITSLENFNSPLTALTIEEYNIAARVLCLIKKQLQQVKGRE